MNDKIDGLTKFCNEHPLNYYQCDSCLQEEKIHGDPKVVLRHERCSRCGSNLEIREKTEMRLPGYMNI